MNKSRNKKGQFLRRTTGEMFEGFPVYIDQKGYKLIWLDGQDVRIHVFVWERVNGPKPPGFDLHHIDLDKGNYSIKNLELLTHSDHQRVHAGWVRFGDEWTHKPCTSCGVVIPIGEYYRRKGYTPSAKCKPCHMKMTTEWAQKNKEKRREIGLRHYYKKKREVKNNA